MDSLIPPEQILGSMTLRGVLDQPTHSPQGPSTPVPKREQKRGEQRPKTPLSLDRESQNEERKSAIDAVKQITGAHKETFVSGGTSVEGTPEYDWNTRYDGI